MARFSLLTALVLLLLAGCSTATPEEAKLPPGMQHALKRYRQAPGVKLFVLTVDPVHGWLWYQATGQLTAKDARSAMEVCEITRQRLGIEHPCTVYLRGDRRVAPLPEEPERQMPRELQAALEEYQTLADHRAFVLAVDPGGHSTWGVVYNYPTPEEAARAAMERCEEARTEHEVRSDCSLWMQDDQFVGGQGEPR